MNITSSIATENNHKQQQPIPDAVSVSDTTSISTIPEKSIVINSDNSTQINLPFPAFNINNEIAILSIPTLPSDSNAHADSEMEKKKNNVTDLILYVPPIIPFSKEAMLPYLSTKTLSEPNTSDIPNPKVNLDFKKGVDPIIVKFEKDAEPLSPNTLEDSIDSPNSSDATAQKSPNSLEPPAISERKVSDVATIHPALISGHGQSSTAFFSHERGQSTISYMDNPNTPIAEIGPSLERDESIMDPNPQIPKNPSIELKQSEIQNIDQNSFDPEHRRTQTLAPQITRGEIKESIPAVPLLNTVPYPIDPNIQALVNESSEVSGRKRAVSADSKAQNPLISETFERMSSMSSRTRSLGRPKTDVDNDRMAISKSYNGSSSQFILSGEGNVDVPTKLMKYGRNGESLGLTSDNNLPDTKISAVDNDIPQVILIPLNGMFDLCYLNVSQVNRLGRSNNTNHPSFMTFNSQVVSRNHCEIWDDDGRVR